MKKKRKRSKSLIEESAITSDSSSTFNDLEMQKRQTHSYNAKKNPHREHNILRKKDKSLKFQKFFYKGNNAEVYSYNENNQRFLRDNELSRDISEFDLKYEVDEMDSNSQFSENLDFPNSLLENNVLKKSFINFNHRHKCWKEFEFPFNFSVGIYLVHPRNKNKQKNPLVLLPKNCPLKYMVAFIYFKIFSNS